MKRFFLAVAAVSILASSHAGAGSRNEGRIGGWVLTSNTFDTTQGFSHCTAMAEYQSGIAMMIAVDSGMKWRMGFVNPRWSLSPGANHPVAYWIDRGPQINATAEVRSRDMAVIELIDSQTLFEAFRRGHNLTVQASGEIFNFSLKDSSASLAMLVNCVARYATVPTKQANPFETAASQDADRANLKIEAARFTANLLSAAGIPGFELAETPLPGYQAYHAVFVAPGLIGGVIISAGTPQEAASQTAALASKTCDGALASAQLPSKGEGVHLRVSCKRTASAEGESNYYFIPRGKGGLYVVELSTVPPSDVSVSKLPDQQSPAQAIQQFSGKVMDASLTIAK